MAEKKTHAYNKKGKLVPVKHCDIAVCEAVGKNCKLHTIDKNIYTYPKMMKTLEKKLCPDTFKRIHNHLILNIDEVVEVLRYKVRHYIMSNEMTVASSKRMNKNYNPE